MMQLIILFMLAIAGAQDMPDANEEQTSEEDVKELKDKMTALELFLQDKKDYKKYCPEKKWTQPSIDEYKKDPKSYLPEGCKPEETEEIEE